MNFQFSKVKRFFLLSCGFFVAMAMAFSQGAPQDDCMRVGDYCDYLNTTAKSDPVSLYDAKMECGNGSIERTGEPGSYRYLLIDEKKNDPVAFISRSDAESYAAWKKITLGINSFNPAEAAVDPLLRSNTIFFSINTSVALGASSQQNDDGYFRDGAIVALLLGLGCCSFGAGCARGRVELMVDKNDYRTYNGDYFYSLTNRGDVVDPPSQVAEDMARIVRSREDDKFRKETLYWAKKFNYPNDVMGALNEMFPKEEALPQREDVSITYSKNRLSKRIRFIMLHLQVGWQRMIGSPMEPADVAKKIVGVMEVTTPSEVERKCLGWAKSKGADSALLDALQENLKMLSAIPRHNALPLNEDTFQKFNSRLDAINVDPKTGGSLAPEELAGRIIRIVRSYLLFPATNREVQEYCHAWILSRRGINNDVLINEVARLLDLDGPTNLINTTAVGDDNSNETADRLLQGNQDYSSDDD